jgi:chaperone modulatory protein CbpM
MKSELLPLLSGDVLEEGAELTLADLCRACYLPAEQVFELVEEGIVEPVGRDASAWRFQGASIRRVRCAVQLRRDLGVNWAGAALALELLDELHVLRACLRRFEG